MHDKAKTILKKLAWMLGAAIIIISCIAGIHAMLPEGNRFLNMLCSICYLSVKTGACVLLCWVTAAAASEAIRSILACAHITLPEKQQKAIVTAAFWTVTASVIATLIDHYILY